LATRSGLAGTTSRSRSLAIGFGSGNGLTHNFYVELLLVLVCVTLLRALTKVYSWIQEAKA
jgi:hypothetical protein